jgi:hypothetical protein
MIEASVRPEARTAKLLRNKRRQPARLQRIDKRFWIGSLLVDMAMILIGELRAERRTASRIS